MLITALAAVAAAALLAVLPSPSPAATTISGRVSGGTLPSAATGVALVHAVAPATSRILDAGRVRRNATYTLTVAPGVVAVLTDVVRADRRVQSAITPFVRARRGRRTTLRVSLKRRRPVRPKASAASLTTGVPVVGVKWFTGSGPWANLGPGLADIITTDVVDLGDRKCGLPVVEVNRRDALQQEIDLQQKYKDLFDPSTIVRKNWLSPTLLVQGKVTTTTDTIAWDIQVVDAKTGAVVGGDRASVPADRFFDATTAISERLVDQLCPRRYEVTLDVTTTSDWPANSAQGTLHSAVTTASTTQAPGTSSGIGTLVYENVTYASHNPECTYVPEASNAAPWKVTVTGAQDGAITVTWAPEGDVYATGTVTCTAENGYQTSAGQQPGPRFQDPTPPTFTLPATGGSQAIGGGLSVGGGGWTHAGTITVTRLP